MPVGDGPISAFASTAGATRRMIRVLGVALVLALAAPALSAQSRSGTGDEPAISSDDHQAAPHAGPRLGRHAIWMFRSFLRDKTDDNNTLGLEFESFFPVESVEIKNISYFEVADYARGVPGQPAGNPQPDVAPASGINDLLTAVWFSKKGAHHGKHHVAFGAAAQFPTAADDTLGSGKWCLGPSIDYEYESGRWFAGAIALQVWSVAGDADRKSVSMLMIKPFVYYTLGENWDLMYVPYGIQVYWLKPSGEKVYVPLGGGAQRKFRFKKTQMNVGAALYNNVVRPDDGTVWDFRVLVEFHF